MRQFLTWRFWLSLLALGGLLGIVLVVRDQASSTTASIVDDLAGPIEHRVDIVAVIVESRPDDAFAAVDGVTVGRLALVLDGGRHVTVLPGTPIDQRCSLVAPTADQAPTPSCVFAADLLGEAVVWLALVPATPRATLDLPPIVEIRDGGWTLLRNGWELRRASSVERDCDADTTSLVDFVRRFGPTSTTTFNLAKQEIVKVSCATP